MLWMSIIGNCFISFAWSIFCARFTQSLAPQVKRHAGILSARPKVCLQKKTGFDVLFRPGQRTQPSPSVTDTLQFRCCCFASRNISRAFFRRGCCRGPANGWIHHHKGKGPQGKKRAGSSHAPARCSMSTCRHGAACVCWGPRLFLDGNGRQFLAREPRAVLIKICPRPSQHRLTNRG